MAKRQHFLFFIVLILAVVSSADAVDSDDDDAETRKNRKYVETVTGGDVKLNCKFQKAVNQNQDNSTHRSAQWIFINNGTQVPLDCSNNPVLHLEGKNVSLASSCKIDVEEDKDDDYSVSSLQLAKVTHYSFGMYNCSTGDQGKTSTFIVVEKFSLLRQNSKGKVETGVTVYEGETLHLFCNASGLSSNKIQKYSVSWWKGNISITENLYKNSGLYENFKKDGTQNLSYYGPARAEHRDYYTCQIELFDNLAESEETHKASFKFFVRVKGNDGWQIPLYVLIGEVALIGLFTLIINRKEKGSDEADGDYEDSDDEDEVQTQQNGEISNNNKNGR